MRLVWVIFQKEVIDNLRDRRSVTSSLLTPLITPIFLVAMILALGKTMLADPQEKPMVVPVAGSERAPALMHYLEQNNVVIKPAPADPLAVVRAGDEDVILVVAEDYPENLLAGQPAAVQMVMDSSRQASLGTIQRVRSLLQSYSQMIGVMRLQARGIDPAVLSPVSVVAVDMATPQSQALIFLNMIPFFLLMTIFGGGMYVIIDATAGERERGSLEPLLINPAARWEIAVGKLLAALPFALATLIISILAFWLCFNVLPIEDYINMPLKLSVQSLWMVFWLMLPVVLLASAMQMLVATFTRSFKEAQTYLGFLPLVAGLPSAFLAFLPVKARWATMLIPTFSQSVLVNQILRSEVLDPNNVLLATVCTVVASLVVVAVSIRLYQRERILFGR